jgi:hypothetical protein
MINKKGRKYMCMKIDGKLTGADKEIADIFNIQFVSVAEGSNKNSIILTLLSTNGQHYAHSIFFTYVL